MHTTSNRFGDAKPQSDWSFNVLRLCGAEYGSLSATRLEGARHLLMTEAEATTAPCLVVDLSAVHYFGASMVGILVAAWSVLRERNRRMVLCGLTPFCDKLVRTMYLDRLFEIVPNQEAAWESTWCDTSGGNGATHSPAILIQKSDVAWAPHLMRVDYFGADGVSIRSVISPQGA
jgi:anti-anti-sigma factor